jgi:catechol 2,3-dioxygenase-like lactoylglutathione lyase family enzyme
MKLTYVIEFVADMDRAVTFYRDVLGLPLKFQSPGWSEFSTGETSLGLHAASEKNPAGSIELGFNVANLGKFHQEISAADETGFRRNPCTIRGLGRSPLQRRRANVKRRQSVRAATFPVSGACLRSLDS